MKQSLRLSLAVAAVTALAHLDSVHAKTANPLDFPACPESHSPEYYCCEYSDTVKHVYTKYNLPTGGSFEDVFRDGWKMARQVNYPYHKFTPDTPKYYYDQPETICRMRTVVVNSKTGEIKQELQCANQNSSLVEDSQDATVFWTYAENPRNNNASFPVGAKCYSLMTSNGKVDAKEKALCVSAASTVTPKFTSYTEVELVVIYVVYLACFAAIFAWSLYKTAMKNKLKATADKSKPLLAHRGGPSTPNKNHGDNKHTQVRFSDSDNQEDDDGILQTGYSRSIFGTIVFAYFIIVTIGLCALLLVIVLDYYGLLPEVLFDPSGANVMVFFIVWLITTVWYAATVFATDSLINFFRVETDLSSCEYVDMLKRDDTELLLMDRSGVSDLIARIEKVFVSENHIKGFQKTVPVEHINELRVVEFQHVRYIYDMTAARFIPGSVKMGETYASILNEASGLTDAEAQIRYNMVGPNAVSVEMPSMAKSLAHEFFTLFYIYQVMCYFVWYYFDYYTLAIVMTCVVAISAVINIYTKRRMQASVVEMTSYTTEVNVYRDNAWRVIQSPDVVPGDLVRVSENWVLPCDMVIVRGSTVCDESMLTGESMPVQKFPVPENSHTVYEAMGSGKKHTLFAGTRVLSSGRNEEIHAVVQTTGPNTSKGELIQSILFPLPMRFKYDEHLKMLIAGLLVFGVIACGLTVYFLTSNGKLSNKMSAFCYCIFVISTVVSPLLPVVITVGQVNASQRLEKVGVFCLNSQRITLCGKVRVFCFDKTGTLTKQGLDFLGLRPVQSTAFTPLVTDVQSSSDISAIAQYALATCHSVGSLDGRLVGNEVEVKMLTASGWQLVEREGEQPYVKSPTDAGLELEFVKRFDFDHHRMSMSVVVRDHKTNKHYVFCKGSYERMQQLSLTESVPADYQKVADQLAKDGCYVLGISFRELPAEWTDADVQALVADREAVDQELSLLGLVLFRNELKPDTADAIAQLKAGDTRVVMITGDNAMCGCYIARQSGMISETSRVILGDVVADELVWRDVDQETQFNLTEIKSMVDGENDVELAVTGRAFDHLVASDEIKELLLKIRIYSRMTPNGKIQCVQLHMETGAVTGMCGDGGNDCGALRIAHVGVALSDADASVVSPFTSRSKTITSVVDLCREGRCSVATSFASVKMLVMYGIIASTLRLFQYYNGVIMSEWCYIIADGFTMVGLSYFITLSRPLPTLGDQRPTSSLIGPTTLVSILGQELINVIFLFIGINLLTGQDWYCPFTPDNIDLAKWWLLSDNAMATCLFYSTVTQQQLAGWVFSFGSRYRLPIWRNYGLIAFMIVLIAIDLYLILGEPSAVTDLFRIASSTNVVVLPYVPLPQSFRAKYLGVLIGDVIAVILFEYIVVLGPVRNYFRNKYHKDHLPMRK
ncbi:hypothetical protein Poli38472_010445 [Pythium oligandrum]|uniref:P-type ATPase A domain-containing protein n=1 Tax=Pythium oligandrum TaxID=41045 RepID=A0A8K1C338_PYTOL|nr:hypothetical protein Poli38472_010445 [Pythium oligandrum]|eukprot:TMW55563.1 hypothetical protein Poli38472_010445 [Pythium oligandrum]